MAVWSLVLPENGQQLIIANAMPGSGLAHNRMGGISRAASGAGSLDDAGPKKPRTWRLRFELLSQAERGVLHGAWLDGGALWLHDPTQLNLLHPNLSMSGAAHRTVEGWSSSGGNPVSIVSTLTNPAGIYTPRAIQWSPTASLDLLDLGKPAPWDVYSSLPAPVEIGEQYTFSAYVQRTAAASLSVNLHCVTVDVAGTTAADSAGSNVVLTTSWQRLTRSFTPATVGTRARFALQNQSGATAAVGQVVAPQLEKGAAATAWAPSQGPALVVVVGFDEPYSYPRAEYTDAEVTLEEIGGPL